VTSSIARIAVAVPTIANGRERLDWCLQAILAQQDVTPDIVLVENGPDAVPACDAWEQQGVTVLHPERNLGVAASWNHAAELTWSRGHGALVLLNDDVVLGDASALSRAAAAAAADPTRLCFLDASRFAAFCLTRELWDAVGPFDEGYWPGYFEDLDWLHRLSRLGLPWIELGVAVDHVGGSSRRDDPELQRLVEQTWSLNAQRYERKWGGPPGSERHVEPWGGGEPVPGTREQVGADAPSPRCLDLGCAASPRGPWGWERWGIDLVPSPAPRVLQADLAFEPIPFEDGSFECVYAYDFLEHIPMRAYVREADGPPRTVNAMVRLFNEIERVLVPGGVFESMTPHLPHWQEAFRDPTHVSFWTEQTWDYLARPGELLPWGRHYGLTAEFELVAKQWRDAHLHVKLRKRGGAGG
jgi:GT2 family glycosyltransferase/SAM-dependent methyltransferase